MASNQLSPSTENCPPAAALLHHSLSSIHVFCHLLGARMETLDSFLSGVLTYSAAGLQTHLTSHRCSYGDYHPEFEAHIWKMQ